MVKFVALYKKPEDPAAFDAWWNDKHLPICKRWPDVERMAAGPVLGAPRGESEHHWMFEAAFKDQPTMMASLMGEAGMEAAMDARASGFGGGMVSFFAQED
ncbi:MAG: EthD family reductase [Candidatus Dormibacteria bacterium]